MGGGSDRVGACSQAGEQQGEVDLEEEIRCGLWQEVRGGGWCLGSGRGAA